MGERCLDIPEGYQYCPNCNALTPHEIYDDGKWGKEEKSCVICGHHEFVYAACDNCGWQHDPDNDIGPDPIVKAHTEECLKFQEEVIVDGTPNALNIRETIKEDCDCPEHKIYPYTLIRNYQSWDGHGFDCLNEKNWSYDVVCPICGNEFYVEDSNC